VITSSICSSDGGVSLVAFFAISTSDIVPKFNRIAFQRRRNICNC
jgi:hypothetical protein